MQPKTVFILFGSLPEIIGRKMSSPMEILIEKPTLLNEVLLRYGVPAENIQLVMLNHKASRLNVMIKPGDRVALFPKEYPIFADWRNFRNFKSASGVVRQDH